MRDEDLITISFKNIFTDDIYNSLGFAKGDKLMVLAKAKSTWTDNIIVRAFEYMVNSYLRYFSKLEIYVIYTGERKVCTEEITLAEEFFGGKKVAIEVTVKNGM